MTEAANHIQTVQENGVNSMNMYKTAAENHANPLGLKDLPRTVRHKMDRDKEIFLAGAEWGYSKAIAALEGK